MKIPKKKNRYCPHCKKHTEHKVLLAKKGKASKLKKSRYRVRKMKKGYGSTPYPQQQKGVKYGAKQSKKTDIRYRCTVCKKQHTQSKGFRAKKLEMKTG
jgi:large subunit ribosomal protein L44e